MPGFKTFFGCHFENAYDTWLEELDTHETSFKKIYRVLSEKKNKKSLPVKPDIEKIFILYKKRQFYMRYKTPNKFQNLFTVNKSILECYTSVVSPGIY